MMMMMTTRREKNDANRKKRARIYIFIYSSITGEEKKWERDHRKKREERIDVICFHLYEALGFGKLGEGMRR